MLATALLTLLISSTLTYKSLIDTFSLDQTKTALEAVTKVQIEYAQQIEEAYQCDECDEGISKKQGGFYDFTFTDPNRPHAKGGLLSVMAEAKYCSCRKGDEARNNALFEGGVK